MNFWSQWRDQIVERPKIGSVMANRVAYLGTVSVA